VTLTTAFINKYTPPRPGIKLAVPSSITIHWIGAFPNQSVADPVKWWVDQKLEASAHFVVKDNAVLYCVPVNEVAWHCGSKGNYTSIGIEVVPASVAGDFGAETIKTLKQLLTMLPQVELLRHYDWTGKECPLYYVPNDKWEQLKKELRDGNY
jgi:N-acetylmuramoyl-L-alanine amidase